MNLVREYVACMDEVSQILSISERKIDFLERLKQDYAILEDSEQPDSLTEYRNAQELPRPSTNMRSHELMVRRIDNAIQHIKVNHEGLPGTLNDLRNSLDDVTMTMFSTSVFFELTYF